MHYQSEEHCSFYDLLICENCRAEENDECFFDKALLFQISMYWYDRLAYCANFFNARGTVAPLPSYQEVTMILFQIASLMTKHCCLKLLTDTGTPYRCNSLHFVADTRNVRGDPHPWLTVVLISWSPWRRVMTGPTNDGLTQRTRGVAEDEIDGAL